MSALILGVSGSPVKNSNTDHAVKAILDASGLDAEFVKLSTLNVGPCRACKACVDDNVCKVKDDFPALAEKAKAARALVIGGYTPYGMLDAFTKAFLERLWSMRHVENLNRGKLAVTVVTGLTLRSVDLASEMIAQEMRMERAEVVGQLKINGNVPCLTCGHGDACDMSAVRWLHGKDARASAEYCVRAEAQTEVWNEALRLGQILGDRVRNGQLGSAPPPGQEHSPLAYPIADGNDDAHASLDRIRAQTQELAQAQKALDGQNKTTNRASLPNKFYAQSPYSVSPPVAAMSALT